jgi:hypothetical protein
MQSPRNINTMIVPTGIGASIGGFAGDANPACKLLAKASDLLITHPNVVNGAMMTDIPENVCVVEGYFLDRFFANQIALRLNCKHKIAVVVDGSATESERNLTINCMRAAKQIYGLDIMEEVFYTEEAVEANDLQHIKNFRTLLFACEKAREQGATAIAVLCVLDEDAEAQTSIDYSQGEGYDPIGLIEAKISHMVAQMTLLPCAHAPIIRNTTNTKQHLSFDSNIKSKTAVLEKEKVYELVDAKVAAEYLSDCFLASVFKALQNSPQIIPLPDAYRILSSEWIDVSTLNLHRKADDIIASQVANLVVPYDSCNGIPMVEAWKNEIQVVCVKNNTTRLDDTAASQGVPHILVNNYLEAAGYLLANSKDKKYLNPELFL